jgi:flagellar motor protein MotB
MAVDVEGQIRQQGWSYRQGLVLGLTMAEIMVLLVFCLLIAMAAFLQTEHAKRKAAEAQRSLSEEEVKNLNAAIRTLSRNSGLVEKIEAGAGSADPAAIDQFWRELVESKAIVSQVQNSGIAPDQLKERIADVMALRDKGIDIQKAIRDAETIASLERLLPESARTQPLADALKQALSTSGHQWPPIITLSEAAGYHFKSGSAELSPEFRIALLTTTPQEILQKIKEFDVDVIEVVGHTDEQPIGSVRTSNLDWDLQNVLQYGNGIETVTPADNAGLGLARAVSVINVLRQSSLLSHYKMLPLSGAQLVNTDETLAVTPNPADVPERRRIEIRLRKSMPHEVAQAIPEEQRAAPKREHPMPPRPRASSSWPAPPQQMGPSNRWPFGASW